MTLTDLRKSKSLTVRALALKTGLSHVTVLDVEKGSDARISVLERYAEGLGMSLDAVLEARRKTQNLVQINYQNA